MIPTNKRHQIFIFVDRKQTYNPSYLIMGAEISNELDSDIEDGMPPHTLSSRSIDAVAQYIKDGAENIVVLTGAGLSTSAGIPDFRTPGTGLYANLERLNLPYAEAVFDISYFQNNPDPFYILAHELYPGKYTPTISHAFIALLAEKGKLRKLFTQNIDCLERQAGVPGHLIIEAHGSFATQRCIECLAEYPEGLMKEAIEASRVPHCSDHSRPGKPDEGCDGLVKPDIVFFGESLPEEFHENINLPAVADLVLIIGTSLTVHPFAALPERTSPGTPRVLFNMERVGSIGRRADDVCVLGPCDDGIRKLAGLLGWTGELEALWAAIKERTAKASVSEEEKVKKITEKIGGATLSENPSTQDKQEKGATATVADETSSKLESSLSAAEEAIYHRDPAPLPAVSNQTTASQEVPEVTAEKPAESASESSSEKLWEKPLEKLISEPAENLWEKPNENPSDPIKEHAEVFTKAVPDATEIPGSPSAEEIDLSESLAKSHI